MSGQLAEQALGLSKAEDCIVIAAETVSANVRWANSSLTTNGSMRGRSLTVVSVVNGAVGSASVSGNVDDEGMRGLVARADAAARASRPADDVAPLPAPAMDSPASWDGASPELELGGLSATAGALGIAFDEMRSHDATLAGFAEQDMQSVWLATSTGVRLRHDQPGGNVAMTARRDDGGASVWAGQQTQAQPPDIAAMTAELSQRLGWAQRRLELPAGRYETLLPPGAIADLLIYAMWSASGRDADEGRSVFGKPGGGTRIGEQLAPNLALLSDPSYPGMECAPFVIAGESSPLSSVFDNGLPLGKTKWIDNGRLTALVDTQASAARSGRAATPYVDNLVMETGGTASLDEMVARTERGLLLTTLWYIREVDPITLLLTGLTRDGVFLVEGGEVVGAVNNFRFNESPIDLLGRISESGATQLCLPREWTDETTRTAMPPVRIDGFNMSSVSKAT